MDEEDLDMLLGRAEKLLGADYEDWMTTYNMSLDSTPLETLKQGGISMGAVNRELDNIEYIVQHRTY
jgi:hypothetical protein